MSTLPRQSIPSASSYMLGLRIENKDEKAAMVRIGVLLDGIVNAQRGHANAGAQLTRRSNAQTLKTPPTLTGSTENVFNGASVVIDPISNSTNLSNYEVEIDTDSNFSAPIQKTTFNKNIIFKGLTTGTTYYLRIRALTKTGDIGPWTVLDPVLTTVQTADSGADFDGTLWGGQFGTVGESKIFTFSYSSEDIFAAANFGNFLYPPDSDGAVHISLYMDTTELIETLEYPTVPLTTDTSGVSYTAPDVSIIRYWPLGFFTLFNPAEGGGLAPVPPNPIMPQDHTFHVDTGSGADYTFESTVFVKF